MNEQTAIRVMPRYLTDEQLMEAIRLRIKDGNANSVDLMRLRSLERKSADAA